MLIDGYLLKQFANRSKTESFSNLFKEHIRKHFRLIVILTVFFSFYNSMGSAQLISPGKLTKSHSKLEGLSNCVKCHHLGKGVLDADCLSCHEKLSERIRAGKGFHAAVQRACIECHTEHKGENFNIMQFDTEKFDHLKTGYELQDKHKLTCTKCHKKEKTYLGLSTACLNCHTDVHQKALPEDCLRCHSFKGWKEVAFDHDKYSEFKLQGKHAQVKCESCHPRHSVKKEEKAGEGEGLYSILKFKPVKHDRCNDCHLDIHKGQLKEKACENCHSPDGWEKKTFEHNNPRLSDFKLQGKHEKVSCELCHPEEKTVYRQDGQGIQRLARKLKQIKHDSCSDCHYDVHQGQFKDKKCDSCHTVEEEWKRFTFKHESEQYKGFKLEGKHKGVECEKCHLRSEIKFTEFAKEKKALPGKFKPVKSETCSDCHKDPHKGQYKQDCGKCHDPASWEPKKFLHDPISFETKGAHNALSCGNCHKQTETFKGLSSECISCHKDPHLNQFGAFCADCHKQSTWIPLNFKHTGVGFRLAGSHRAADCKDCHINRDYRNTPSDCFACHKTDYQTAPMHVIAGFSRDCITCHRITATWQQATYTHETFSFTGAHSTLKKDCAACHNIPGGIPPGTTDQDCYTCHESDFQAAPDHVAFDFDHDCRYCHSGNTWVIE